MAVLPSTSNTSAINATKRPLRFLRGRIGGNDCSTFGEGDTGNVVGVCKDAIRGVSWDEYSPGVLPVGVAFVGVVGERTAWDTVDPGCVINIDRTDDA